MAKALRKGTTQWSDTGNGVNERSEWSFYNDSLSGPPGPDTSDLNKDKEPQEVERRSTGGLRPFRARCLHIEIYFIVIDG